MRGWEWRCMCRMRKATRDVRGNRGCHARASGHPVTGGRAIRAGAALLGTGRRLLDRPPARTMTAGGLGDVQVGASGRGRDVAIRATPTPNPSPQGGGEQTERVATIYYPAEESRLAKRALGPKHEARSVAAASFETASHRSQACAGCVNLPALRLLRMRRRDHRRRGALTSARVSSSRASPSRRRSAATCRNARRSATSRRRP